MDDDTLDTDVEDLNDEQIERLRAQGAKPAGYRLAKVAVQAMVDKLADGMGVTIEVLESE